MFWRNSFEQTGFSVECEGQCEDLFGGGGLVVNCALLLSLSEQLMLMKLNALTQIRTSLWPRNVAMGLGLRCLTITSTSPHCCVAPSST
jgi:hypothetical protein